LCSTFSSIASDTLSANPIVDLNKFTFIDGPYDASFDRASNCLYSSRVDQPLYNFSLRLTCHSSSSNRTLYFDLDEYSANYPMTPSTRLTECCFMRSIAIFFWASNFNMFCGFRAHCSN
jgi:hypothetical protein